MRLSHRVTGVAFCLALAADPAGATTIDNGTLVINGTIQSFTAPLVVGSIGTGALQVSNGGQAYATQDSTVGRARSATGSVLVDGAGSRFSVSGHGSDLTVGDAGTGSFSVSNGGSVTGYDSPSVTILGNQVFGNGRVTVTGSGSLWEQGSGFVLGRSGTALFEVLDGAALSHGGAIIELGLFSGSSGRLRVSGPGASWLERSPSTSVGVSGFGAIEILGGATTSHFYGEGNVELGVNPSGIGELWVSGAGSSFDRGGNLGIGERGSGLAVVRDQGMLRAADLSLGNQAGGNGTLRIEDASSDVQLTGSFYVGKVGVGRFEVRNGATATVGGSSTGGSTYIGFANGSSGSVLVEGPGSSWQSGWPAALHIGESGTGSLAVAGGASLGGFSAVRLGVGASGSGSVLVEGADSRFWASTLSIGDSARGDVQVRSGAVATAWDTSIASSGGSVGSAVVEGAGTLWGGSNLYVGLGGIGSLSVRDAARVELQNELVLGQAAGATGYVDLRGPTTGLDAYSLSVGRLGTGEFQISDGASATLRGFDVDGASRATIDGANLSAIGLAVGGQREGAARGGSLLEVVGGGSLSSTWFSIQGSTAATSTFRVEGLGSSASFSDFVIAGGGQADAVVFGGGQLTSTFSDIGNGARGSLVVEGPGSRWSSGRMRVANAFGFPSSTGSVQVRAGGEIETTGSFGEVWVGQIQGAVGNIEVDGPGSRWRANGLGIAGSTVAAGGGTGSARIANGGVFDASGGKVAVWQKGTLDLAGGRVLAQDLDLRGRLEGDGAIAANLTNAGVIAPGHSPGLIEIEGDFVQSVLGRLEIEIFGAADAEHDRLAISGDAILNGVLSVHLGANAFALMGVPVYFLEADSISGAFQSLETSGIDPGLLQLTTEGGRASLTIIPEPATAMLLAAGLVILSRLRCLRDR